MPDLLKSLACLAGTAILLLPAQADPAGDALALAVFDRPANEGRVATMRFRMISSGGQERTREALMAHSDTGDLTRIGIFFTAPASIEGTAFLTHDADAGTDESWIYLPVTERTRRLPSSDRGDYFMGTDLTYGDIKDNFRFDPADWDFTSGGTVTADGRTLERLDGTVKNDTIRAELDYASFSALIDPETLFPAEVTFTDAEGERLKRIEILETELVGGAWTAMRFHAENFQTGHRTEIYFEDMRHVPDLDDATFDPEILAYGVPDIG